jgi:hypothetical protein
VFENRVRIFEPERDDMTGGWRKLHSEEPKNLYSAPNTIKVKKKVKQSLYTPWRRLGGEEV